MKHSNSETGISLKRKLTSLGQDLDPSPEAFGWLRSSTGDIDSPSALRERFAKEGYLFLPDYLDKELVDAARQRLLEQLSGLGLLDPQHPVEDGFARLPWQGKSLHHLVSQNEPLQQLLYAGRMMDLYASLFDCSVRHFDFTWMRVMGQGSGTAPHADSVYMNRGTSRLCTSWTPLMEIPLEVGGLMVMPGSHKKEKLRDYFDGDVDTYCTNKPNHEPKDVHGWIGPVGDGKLSSRPATLQKRLKLPWMTAETWRPGDVIVFSIHTVHASLDNHSKKLRLSSDSRYQPADEPADPRWIGAQPIGHGANARKGMIC